MSDVRRFPDPVSAAQACGRRALDLLAETLNRKEWATLAISGGSSPKAMFALFAASAFSWERVHIFWVDERYVPPADPQSNFRMAKETWLDPAKVPEGNIHRIPTDGEPHAAALEYAEKMQAMFGVRPPAVPQIDVIHRGMGPDAHTASLFPGEPLITMSNEASNYIAAAVWVEKMSQWRITLLPPVLEAARHTLILAAGEDKAEPLRLVLQGPYEPLKYPAQIGAVGATWFIDIAAGALLDTAKESA
jgi:6-phosphogluconolactonase